MPGITVDEIVRARTAKAARLATTMRTHEITPNDAAHLIAAARRGVEREAGVRLGSPETWATAIDMLAGSARVPCPFCNTGDPDGVPGPPQRFWHEGPCSR